MTPEKNRRILVIDDNRAIHDDFRKILASKPEGGDLDDAEALLLGTASTAKAAAPEVYELQHAYQGEEGYNRVRAAVDCGMPYAMAFVDMRMPPGWDGVETIRKIWEADDKIEIVVCTAYSDYSWDEMIQKLGHVDRLLILKKPFDTVEVCQFACALTQKWELGRQAGLKMTQLREMVDAKTASLQREIAQRRNSEEEMRQSQKRYALAVNGANDGIWDWDFSTDTIFYSPRWKSMLGMEENEVTGKPDEWLSRVHPDDLNRVRHDLDQHLIGHSKQLQCEFRLRHKDLGWRWVLCRGVAVFDEAGRPQRAAGSLTDITERKTTEEQIQHDALHDPLTGLANRNLLMDRIDRCIRRTPRAADPMFAVIFIDLDRFKNVNDVHGHDAGDTLLLGISRRLAEATRASDTIARAESENLARLGGDEFVLLLDSVRSPVDAIRVCQRIQEFIAPAFTINGQQVRCTVTLGIAIGNGNYSRPEDVLRDADTALYTAKANGRGTYQIFHQDMHASAVQRLWMENELRGAIDRAELVLMYQPVVSVQSGRVVEVETLIRWNHPARGMIPPMDFIPLAEETGLIFAIGDWVLHQACSQLHRWHAQVPELAHLNIGVNVSCRQFARGDMLETVRRILNETGVPANYLKLEITETAVMGNVGKATIEMKALRDSSVQFHLDDFGTGYSSLGYLQKMPIECLKIDKSFVSAMSSEEAGSSIVQAIIALAHSLKMRVIAEGVETVWQWETLKAMGCDFAQGYYFAKPLTAIDVVEFAKKQARVVLPVAA